MREGRAPTALGLFGTFAFISAVTIGGGYAMVPVIGRSLEKKGWLSEEEFHRLFARAQSFPGPFALTTALICGQRLGGLGGAAASGAGIVLPPFGALILVGAFLGRFGEIAFVRDFLAGAGATVPGLVAAMIWKMSRKRSWTALRAISVIVLAVLLSLFPSLTLPIFFASLFLLYRAERLCSS